MTHWAYLFHAPESDPATDRFILDKGGSKASIVACPSLDAATKVAAELADDGAKSIELCGFFGVNGVVAVREAVQGKAAVSGVMFSAEALVPVVKAFGIPV